MKKSILLFFAAIMCAVSINAADWYVKGNFDNWSGGAKMSGNASVVSCEIWLQGNKEYEFKMNNDGIWLGVDGTMTLTNNLAWGINGGNNAKIKTSVEGNYIFTWYISDRKLSVTYPDQSYYIAGTNTILEDNWSANASKNKMGKNGEEFVLIKYNLQLKKGGDYKYKMTPGSWDSSYPGSDVKIDVSADGKYDVMFTYNPKTGELKHILAQSVTIYCINTKEWDNISIHNWLTTDFATSWPGDAMTKTGEKWAGYDIYKKEISGLHKYCIFTSNNGEKKTDDLTIEGTYYELATGKWYNSLPTPKICWKGDVNNWSEKNTFAVTNNDPNLFTTTVALSKGEHKFKVSICDLWLSNPGTMKRHGESVHEGGWDFKNATADECKIEADIEGSYIFTWNISEKKLTVTYPLYPDLNNQPDVIYFKPSERWTDGNARFAAYFCKGNTKDKWGNFTLADQDGIYKVDNAKEHTTIIIVRMNPDHSENKWDDGYKWDQTADLYIPMDGNNWFKMTATGENWDKSGEWLYYKKVNVTVSASPVEGGLVASEGTYMYGEDVTLTATANEGYKFVNWTKGGEIVSTDATYTFTATEDAEFVANFEKETYTRTVTPGNYGTICLPYASSNYTGMELYEVSWLKEGTGLYLDQLAAGAQLVAGKPYIFKATDSEITVTYTGEAVAAPVAGAKGLTGTFTDIATGDAALVGNYIIAQNQIWIAGAGNSLPANRAYINALLVPKTEQAKLPGRRRVCMGENAATGLDNITNGENTTIKVIENGQLFIIRNGEKFNAQGQKL